MTSFSSRVESGSLYLQVPLAVVLEWDLATRQRLLFEGFLLNGQADGMHMIHGRGSNRNVNFLEEHI